MTSCITVTANVRQRVWKRRLLYLATGTNLMIPRRSEQCRMMRMNLVTGMMMDRMFLKTRIYLMSQNRMVLTIIHSDMIIIQLKIDDELLGVHNVSGIE